MFVSTHEEGSRRERLGGWFPLGLRLKPPIIRLRIKISKCIYIDRDLLHVLVKRIKF